MGVNAAITENHQLFINSALGTIKCSLLVGTSKVNWRVYTG
jgi:hypothetical protein